MSSYLNDIASQGAASRTPREEEPHKMITAFGENVKKFKFAEGLYFLCFFRREGEEAATRKTVLTYFWNGMA